MKYFALTKLCHKSGIKLKKSGFGTCFFEKKNLVLYGQSDIVNPIRSFKFFVYD